MLGQRTILSRRVLGNVIKAKAEVATRNAASFVPREQVMLSDPKNNVPSTIYDRMNSGLFMRPNHPLGIIKNLIYSYFDGNTEGVKFEKFDELAPVVTIKANFDDVLVPADHVSRSANDTYYVDGERVLRCHTSAHQAELLAKGHTNFLVTGDVYRRDAIDATHYPVFHQMEGVRVFGPDATTEQVVADLKAKLEGLARLLFGDVEMRWIDAYFPFTEPSLELEVFFNGQWLEVLGCGVMQQQILDGNGQPGKKAWAFGLGLERLAMILFGIPDIRLFWSDDERFTKQFKAGDIKTKFAPFSKFPPCYKDVSMWIGDSFTENNMCEIVRGIAGDLVEEVKLIDQFVNKKTNRTSVCYRVVYRSMERSLTDEEINELQGRVREALTEELKVELR